MCRIAGHANQIRMGLSGTPLSSFTKDVYLQLAKCPMRFNGRLANHGLTSFVKEATGIRPIGHRSDSACEECPGILHSTQILSCIPLIWINVGPGNNLLSDGTNHYLNQCWRISSKVPWHSSEGTIIRTSAYTNKQRAFQWNAVLPGTNELTSLVTPSRDKKDFMQRTSFKGKKLNVLIVYSVVIFTTAMNHFTLIW